MVFGFVPIRGYPVHPCKNKVFGFKVKNELTGIFRMVRIKSKAI
jgi:hypothetical protein